MTTAAPPKNKVSAKLEVKLKSQSHVDPQPATGCQTKQSLEADSAATAEVMDGTLELLKNSHADSQMDAQDTMDDVRQRAAFLLLLFPLDKNDFSVIKLFVFILTDCCEPV